MEDDEEQARIRANLRNPKNKFLGLFCHANEVGETLPCGIPFNAGVNIIAIVIGITIIIDIYYLAADEMLSSAEKVTGFKTMLIIKIVSDLISAIGIGFGVYAVTIFNSTFSIVAYYVEVLSFLLNTAFCLFCLIEIFNTEFWKIVGVRIFSWIFAELALLLFCWILFCCMVYITKKIIIHNQKVTEMG